MVMDYLRSGSYAWMKLYRNSDQLTRVRWYRAAPGALDFPHPQALASNVWNTAPWENPSPDLGQQYIDGYAPSGTFDPPAGDHFHGDADWFLNGIPTDPLPPPVMPCVTLPNLYCILLEDGGDLLIEDSPGCIQIEH